jgi:hypothetical protein
VPELCNLIIVGTLFFLIFGLFGLAYFKGSFYDCQIAADGELGGFSFVKQVSFVAVKGSSAFTVVDPEVASSTPDASYVAHTTKMTPLCVLPGGHAKSLGAFDDDEAFVINGTQVTECTSKSMKGVHFIRPSYDTPICAGHCSMNAGKDDPRPKGCPAPLERTEQLPSVCPSDADELRAMKLASQRGKVTITDEDTKTGKEYFEAMMARPLMPCSSHGLPKGYLGCREAYCPDGSDTAPTASKIEQCETWCDIQAGQDTGIYCGDTCLTGDDSACQACKMHCRAACECPEFCEATAKEAAMCTEQGGGWIANLDQNFDNIGSAMLTLLEISTTEGWVDVMYAGVDSTGPFNQPIRDIGELWSLFFVLFILVGSFFIMNLVIGVIVDNYTVQKADGAVLLTDDQKNWVSAHKALMTRRCFFGLTNLDQVPQPQRKAYEFVNRQHFETSIMACIVLNTILMGMKVFPSPSETYADVLGGFNYTFAIIFLFEAILKLFALRGNYFKDGWNLFDFTCVCATIVGFVVDRATDIEIGAVMSAIRIFRIARLFRLVKFAKGLNRLFTAFVLSLPKLLNVFAILMLLLFLFTVLGVQIFARIKFLDQHSVHANFQDFYRGIMTLLRCSTGEAFNSLMHNLSKNAEFFTQVLHDPCYPAGLVESTEETWPILKAKCLIDYPNQCGTDLSYVYFITYLWVIAFVILNLVVAVILEGFDDSSKNEVSEIVDRCIWIWKKYDTNCDMKISLKDTFRFVADTARAFDCPPLPVDEIVNQTSGTLDLTKFPMKGCCAYKVLVSDTPEQDVHFIHALKWALRVVLSANDKQKLKEIDSVEDEDDGASQRLEEAQARRQNIQEKVTSQVLLSVLVATAKIQERFRAKRAGKRRNLNPDGGIVELDDGGQPRAAG